MLWALLFDDLANAQKVSVWIDDGELPEPPWLVFQWLHTRDSLAGQLALRTRTVNSFNVQNTDVAARGRIRRNKFLVREEVKLDFTPTQYGVVTIKRVDPALEPKALVEINCRV